MKTTQWKKILLSIVSGVLVPGLIYAANVTLPHAFTAGTPIRAEEVNANFSALRDAVNQYVDTRPASASGQRLKVLGLASPDGLRFGAVKSFSDQEELLYDSALSMYCIPWDAKTSNTTREVLCIPEEFSYAATEVLNPNTNNSYSAYADANCTTPFYFRNPSALPASLPPAQPYSTEYDANDIIHVYRMGQHYTGSVTVYGNTSDDPTCVNLGAKTVDYYARGSEVPLADLARLTPTAF